MPDPLYVVARRALLDALEALGDRRAALILVGALLYTVSVFANMSGMAFAVVLHAFIKKTQQTPDRELTLARTRLKRLQDG